MRREKNIKPKTSEQILITLQPRLDHYAGLMGISDHLVDKTVATVRLLVHDPDVQAAATDILDGRNQVASNVVKERLSVGQKVLQVTHLRAVDRRIVDLTQDSPRHCEPHAARGGVCGADRFLRTPVQRGSIPGAPNAFGVCSIVAILSSSPIA
jgi:hypothetical protein